jgi:hypothetical protein
MLDGTVAKKVTLAALLVLSAAAGIWFVWHFGVNVPYWDEWHNVDILQKLSTGHLTFSDLWNPHNEHRIFFPNLLVIAVAKLVGYNSVFQMLIGQGILAVGLFLLILSFRSSTSRENKNWYLLALPVPLLFYSFSQFENFIWGFQTAFILADVSAIAACFFSSRFLLHRRNTDLALMLCCGVVSSFSSAMGLFSWLCLVPMVFTDILNKKKLDMRLALVAAIAILCWIGYLYNYQSTNHNSSLYLIFQNPLKFLKYFFVVVGSSLFHDKTSAFIVGVLLSMVSLAALVMIVQSRTVDRFSFWISLLLFSYATLFFLSIGRAGMGIDQALSSRYVTFSVLIPISLFAICSGFMDKNNSNAGAPVYWALIGLFLVSFPQTVKAGISSGHYRHEWGIKTRFYIQNLDNTPDSFIQKHIDPEVAAVRQLVPLIDGERNGMFSGIFSSSKALPTETRADFAPTISLEAGNLGVTEEGDVLSVAGAWAVDEKARRPVGAILIDVNGHQVRMYYGIEKPDVGAHLGSSRYNRSGFEGYIPVAYLHEGSNTFKVAAVDAGMTYRSSEKDGLLLELSKGKLTVKDSAGGETVLSVK